jgi:hypothetical protein
MQVIGVTGLAETGEEGILLTIEIFFWKICFLAPNLCQIRETNVEKASNAGSDKQHKCPAPRGVF